MNNQKLTQKQRVIQQLESGSCSRNWALLNYISRLGAIICELNKEGWVIEGGFKHYQEGMDYIYNVVLSPKSAPGQAIAPLTNKDAITTKVTQDRLFKPQQIIN